jgi:hypothetical protein
VGRELQECQLATTLTPVTLFKHAGFYNYQTCEHDAYETSNAYALVQAIQTKCQEILGVDRGVIFEMPEYDRAPWGLDSLVANT